jgi:hypothetical protein
MDIENFNQVIAGYNDDKVVATLEEGRFVATFNLGSQIEDFEEILIDKAFFAVCIHRGKFTFTDSTTNESAKAFHDLFLRRLNGQ